jgi:hypothetical protein
MDARLKAGHDGPECAVTLYSVYEPRAEAPDLIERADRLAFVKEGFCWPALFVPLLWLIYQRMWVELGVLVVVLSALQWALGFDPSTQALSGWVSLALIFLFAFEANDLRVAALKRGGFTLAGIAAGAHRDAAELAFFRSWLPQQSRSRETEPASAAERGREQVPHSVPARSAASDEVIGLFPRA